LVGRAVDAGFIHHRPHGDLTVSIRAESSMEVLILTVFVSLVLVAGELVFFAWNVKEQSHDHSDRLSLLPLENERWTLHSRNASAKENRQKES
jgi:nitrogen fixation-related uncharacterized protein